MKKRVCLFGTSANPPTGESGHLGIIQHLASLDEFDEIRILPVYVHMFASKRNKLASFEQRYEMCQLNFRNVPKVTVSQAEKNCFEKAVASIPEHEKSSVRVGTAELLEMFIMDEPDTLFTLTLGRDTFMDLTDWKWRRSRDILSLLEGRLLVIHRLQEGSLASSSTNSSLEKEKHNLDELNLQELKKRVDQTNKELNVVGHKCSDLQKDTEAIGPIKVIQIPTLSDVSSSLVRTTTDKSLLLNLVTTSVLEYISSHQLYGFNESNDN